MEISKWQEKLGLSHWEIRTEPIDKDQVQYPPDIEEDEKFFVGIKIERDLLLGIIYHDRELTEEDVVHELLHVKYPEKSEQQINKLCKKYLK